MAHWMKGPHTERMPTPGRASLGEALITTTLWSIYLGSRGTVLAIAAAQTGAGAAASVRESLSTGRRT
jgi:hypothetical protein